MLRLLFFCGQFYLTPHMRDSFVDALGLVDLSVSYFS